MNSRVSYIRPPTSDIGHFIRLGHTAHQQLADWAAGGIFRPQRTVANPVHMESQWDLLSSLRASGTQVVLDTKGAELGSRSCVSGSLQRIPWAKPEGYWGPEDFDSSLSLSRHVELISEFVSEHPVDSVMVPAHYLEPSVAEAWLRQDTEICLALRNSLDRAELSRTQLIYPLVLPYKALEDYGWLSLVATRLRELPISSVWLRISNVGISATPAAIKRTVEALDVLLECNRPIVVDYVGGLAAFALCSVGAASGFAHGILMKENFRSSDLSKERKPNSGGFAPRVYLANAQTYVSSQQFDALMSARGMKSRFACTDPSCCGNKFRLMQEEFRKHFIVQRQSEFESFQATPEHRRASQVVSLLQRAADTSDAATRSKELATQSELVRKFATQATRFRRQIPVIEQLSKRRPMPLFRPPLPPLHNGSSARTDRDAS